MAQTTPRKFDQEPAASPWWMRRVLLLAGFYNLVWGTFVICFPLLPFLWARMEPPRYPEIWQCVGMIVGVYGVGYMIAAFDPLRHWPIILVGFLGKVFGPIGMLIAISQGNLPIVACLTCLTNDVIWWVPFGMILWRAFQTGRVGNMTPRDQ